MAHVLEQARRNSQTRPDSTNSGEFELAIAVLHRATDDLQRGRPGLKLWWEWKPNPALVFWCSVLDLDPGEVRERALALP